MTTLLPTDADNNPIPALRLKSGGAHIISVTGSSARNSTPFNAETKVISLYADGPVYIALGDSTIEAAASDHYLPEGLYYDVAVAGGQKGPQATHIAAIAADDNCTLYISERE